MSSVPFEDLQVPENRKKRKLALTKCDRCRQDKQKCTPVEPPRVWPAKCDRCLEKNFPCSEGRRVQRKSKHDVAEPTHQTIRGESSASNDMEKLLRLRESLINCQTMMDMALDHLKHIISELIRPFIDENDGKIDFSASLLRSPTGKLDVFYGGLRDKISKTAETIISRAINSGTLIGSKIILELMEQTTPNFHGQFLCPFCNAPEGSTTFPSIAKSKTISSEVLYRLGRLREHANNPTHLNREEFADIIEGDEVATVLELMVQARTEFEGAVSDVGLIGFLPSITRGNLIFMPDNACYRASIFGYVEMDCLGRYDLQLYLDNPAEPDLDLLVDWFEDGMIDNVNHQDILGRTALHIAGQKGLTKIVKLLMENDAKPDLRTVCGTLPLHYAVLNESLMPKTVIELYKLTLSRTLDLSDNAGNDPLMYLIHSASYGRLRKLVQSGYEVLAVHIKKAIRMDSSYMLNILILGCCSPYEEICNSLLDGDPVQVTPGVWAEINSHYDFEPETRPVWWVPPITTTDFNQEEDVSTGQ